MILTTEQKQRIVNAGGECYDWGFDDVLRVIARIGRDIEIWADGNGLFDVMCEDDDGDISGERFDSVDLAIDYALNPAAQRAMKQLSRIAELARRVDDYLMETQS